MGITGWIHPSRDLRLERATLTTMAHACNTGSPEASPVHLAESAAFVCQGKVVEYADARHQHAGGPELMVAVEGQLYHSDQLQSALGLRSEPQVSCADVLLHAYRRWGVRLVDYIDGIYAIAVWDIRERQLLLICDRAGAKTWFWTGVDDGLLFATSMHSLATCPGMTAVIDADGLNELLTLGPVRTPGHGVLRGVRELAPGHLVRAVPGRVCTYQYRRWPTDRHGHDVETTTAFLRHLLADVTLPLREQPPGAVLLSGGIASAAAAAFTCTGEGGVRPAAYTLALAGPWSQPPHAGVDVTAATRTATHLDLRRTLVTPKADAVLEAGDTARAALDLPGESATDAARLTLLRRVAVDTSSVVTGDGAASVFGDHGWQHRPEAADRFGWHRRDLAPVDLLCADARLHLLPEVYLKYRYAEAIRAIPAVIAEDATGRAHRHAAYLALTHYLPAQLRRLDQLAAVAGLAVHAPFAVWPLVQYLAGVPYPVRHLTTVRQGLLRHAVADLLPAAVTWLPSLPPPSAHVLSAWRRSLHEQLRYLLSDPAQPLQPLLDQFRIADLLNRPARQRPRGWHTSLAYLLDVNAWLTRHHVTIA